MSSLRYLLSGASTNFYRNTYVDATLQRLPVSSDHAIAVLLECVHPNIGPNCIAELSGVTHDFSLRFTGYARLLCVYAPQEGSNCSARNRLLHCVAAKASTMTP